MNQAAFRYLPTLVALLSILCFAVLAGRFISLPGLQYDEVLFVNAALGGVDDSFIHKRIHGIPVMLMPYIGALKSFLYYPVFKLFGVCVESIRIPVIAISCMTLWIGFSVGRFLYSRGLACLLGLLVATDPAFVFQSKLDWGPVVLMMFFKMLGLHWFFRFIRTGTTSYLWGTMIVLLLGVYDKLTFIWFILALIVAAMVAFRGELTDVYRRTPWRLLAPLVPLFLIVLLIGVRIMKDTFQIGKPEVLPFPTRWAHVVASYQGTMDGRLVYEFVTDVPLPSPSLVNFFFVPALVILALEWFLPNRKRERPAETLCPRAVSAFFAILFALIFMQIALTPQAGGPHHFMVLHPFHHFFTLSAASVLLSAKGKLPKGAAKALVVILFGTLLTSQVVAVTQYWKAFRDKRSFSAQWSPEIYNLVAYLDQNHQRVDRIISTDWGFHTQLLSLAKEGTRSKCKELWASFNDLHEQSREQRKRLYEQYFANRSAFVLLHGEDASVIKNARRNFFSFASEFLNSANVVQVFIGAKKGKHLYEVYLVQ